MSVTIKSEVVYIIHTNNKEQQFSVPANHGRLRSQTETQKELWESLGKLSAFN